MSAVMQVDEKATARARGRQKRGLERLRALFRATPAKIASAGLQHGNARPARLGPGVPPVRDAEHQAKHRRRKAARAARKRNRR